MCGWVGGWGAIHSKHITKQDNFRKWVLAKGKKMESGWEGLGGQGRTLRSGCLNLMLQKQSRGQSLVPVVYLGEWGFETRQGRRFRVYNWASWSLLWAAGAQSHAGVWGCCRTHLGVISLGSEGDAAFLNQLLSVLGGGLLLRCGWLAPGS